MTQHGLVISYFGTSVAVEDDNGQVFQCHLRRNQELPIVGDRVEYQLVNAETGTISAILPRKSLLAKGDHHGKLKPLAANLDAVIMVMAPAPIFSNYLLDRYLIAAELLGLQPIIVLNKVDLLNDEEYKFAEEQLKPYQKLNYPVVLSSIFLPDKIDELRTLLASKTGVLVGPSGVGKSSIIATLGDQYVKVGEVSAKGAGKHTTTATYLYHLPQATNLIDSPGVREFNLWPVNRQELIQGFKEFKPYLGSCKFRDCQHSAEPGCVIKAAVEKGEINKERFQNYQTLLKEIETNKKY